MSHELATQMNGEIAYAHTGSKSEIWHGLGKQLDRNAPIEQWITEAGFDWDIIETPALFRGIDGELHESNEKKILLRSDLGTELSVVGTKYKVVQPKDVLEFFRDIVSDTGMYLDSAGILFGGRRFFANANTNLESYVGMKDDTIKANLLMASSCDSTFATQCYTSSIRTVCQNTLRFSMQEAGNTKIRVTHKSAFDASKIKSQLGNFSEAWGMFIENCNVLASKKISDADAMAVIQKLIYSDPVDPSTRSVNQADLIMSLYKNGTGSEMTYGNMYGLLQGFTEYTNYFNTARNEDAKVWSAMAGAGHDLNIEAFDTLLELV